MRVRPILGACLLLALHACKGPEPIPRKDWVTLDAHARLVTGRETLNPEETVSALRDLAKRHPDSPQAMLREAYFLLLLWPKDVEWDRFREACLRHGVTQASQWVAGNSEDRWYRFSFTVQTAAWTSLGGHRYDLVFEGDARFDVQPGRKTRGRVGDPEVSLRAEINLDRRHAPMAGRYAPDSIFRLAMEKGTTISEEGDLPFVTSIEAHYGIQFDRWQEASRFGFEINTEFVDHPASHFETSSQTSYAESDLDPPVDGEHRLRPDLKVFSYPEGPFRTLGGSGSSMGSGHGLVRLDPPPKKRGGC